MHTLTPSINVDSMLDQNKTDIQADFRCKHEELRLCRELFRNTVDSLRTKGLVIHSALWNAALHVNLAAEDLSYLVEDLAFERNDWKRRMAARHMVLMAYETAEDIQALLGKTFRDALDCLGVLPQFEKELGEVRKPLQEFWCQHQKSLKQIRITVAAHRHHDGIVFVKTIEDINIDDILKIGFELNGILLDIGRAMKEILDKTSQIQDPRHQAINEAMEAFQEVAKKIIGGYTAFDESLNAFGLEIERIDIKPEHKDDNDIKAALSNLCRELEPICTEMEEASTTLQVVCSGGPIAVIHTDPSLIDANELGKACDHILKGTAQREEIIVAYQMLLNALQERKPQSTIKDEVDDLTRILGLFTKSNFSVSDTITTLRDVCRYSSPASTG